MDYIYVINDDGKREKMEVATILDFSNTEYKYIIYKPLDREEYFVGKFKGEKVTNLDTNLTDKEIKMTEDLFNKIRGNYHDTKN